MKNWPKAFAVFLVSTSLLGFCQDTMPAANGVLIKAQKLMNPFFAMDTGTRDAKHPTAKSQAEMLKELGYAGIGYSGVNGIPEMLRELDRCELKMFTVYLGVTLDPDKQAYDPQLKEAIQQLKGRDTILWLTIGSSEHGPSSVDGDPRAVGIIREIADMARASGLRVAIYPHVNTWLERAEHAVRVAKKVNRENVGVTFNLCHWLSVVNRQCEKGRSDAAAADEMTMKWLMERAMPYLFVVTINGSSPEGTIETLDKGEFDVYKFLKKLNELGYTGLIGLQGYGLKGDVRENLSRSMEAWRGFSARMAAEKD